MAYDREEVLKYHLGGKVAVALPKPLKTKDDLCLAYTPGVAHAVKAIAEDPKTAWDVTAKRNLVAVVSDGTAILGLGDLGAAASVPVMEGKAVLFKAFADVDAWPVPLAHCRKDGKDTGPTDPQRVIDAVMALAPQYGGVNLEDIAAPACFEIEDKLDKALDIPVFHDDQWGTAVISLSGVMNYAKLAGKELKDLKIVMNGAGAAGIRICEMCKAAGVVDVTMCDSKGTIRRDRTDLNPYKARHAVDTTAKTLKEAIVGADVFIGVSAANVLSGEDVAKMTGRSDYPNQINNVLGFPYLFRGALDVRATTINTEMKVAAANALAMLARESVPDDVKALYPDETLEFGTGYIIPKPFDRRLKDIVPAAVAEAARRTGVARL